MSRLKVEELSSTPFPTPTALISITDYNYDFAELKNKPNHILQLAFDDVDNDVFVDELGRKPLDAERILIEAKYHMLTDSQAKQIADFYREVADKVEVIICQCEHGQSRSAAVAAAFMEYVSKNGIEIFAHDDYYPNKAVFKKVLKYLTL